MWTVSVWMGPLHGLGLLDAHDPDNVRAEIMHIQIWITSVY